MGEVYCEEGKFNFMTKAVVVQVGLTHFPDNVLILYILYDHSSFDT